MKGNSNEENSNKQTNQVVKNIQNENEDEFITSNEIDKDKKIKKMNNKNITNRLSNGFHLLRTELDYFQNNYQSLENINLSPTNEFHEQSNDVKELSNNGDKINNDVEQLKNDVHEINNIHNLRNASHGLRNEVQDLKNAVHGLSNEVHDLSNEVHDLSNEVNDLSNEVHDLRNEVHDLRTNFDNFFNRSNILFHRLNQNENSDNNNEQNNNINYDELLDEKELDGKCFEKFKEEKCAICLEDFNIGNKVCYLPCLHIYHSFCIKNWIKIRVKCPLCGKVIFEKK